MCSPDPNLRFVGQLQSLVFGLEFCLKSLDLVLPGQNLGLVFELRSRRSQLGQLELQFLAIAIVNDELRENCEILKWKAPQKFLEKIYFLKFRSFIQSSMNLSIDNIGPTNKTSKKIKELTRFSL